VGPGNHVLDGGPDLPMLRGNFEGKGTAHCIGCIGTVCDELCKRAEPIEMVFGTLVGRRKPVLDGYILMPPGEYS